MRMHNSPTTTQNASIELTTSAIRRPSAVRARWITRLFLGVCTAAGGTLLLGVPVAGASTNATATIGAGTLNVVVPNTVSFSATLNGSDQTATSPLAIDVQDATGSGTGWNLTATSTQFTTGTYTLSDSATTVQNAPTDACDAGATCTAASNSISYPYSLPAGSTAPSATKLYDAASASGLGDQTVTPTFGVAIPANTYAGTYTSTWTVSVVSGP
jgi:hypothetical protein